MADTAATMALYKQFFHLIRVKFFSRHLRLYSR